MKLYLSIISVCMAAIAAVASAVFHVNFFIVFGCTILATLLVILVDGITAGLARALPKKVAKHDAKIYIVSVKEKQFYERLRIRAWKEKVPEIGHFTGFRKNKIADPKSVEYVERFLMEACYGELGHFASLFTGFLILLFQPLSTMWLAVAIPVAVVNFILNVPFVIILRYNCYKLENLLKSNQKRLKR